ncbi:Coenzyme F420-reducing hydrogenase, gamma subunit [Thermoplasmatales archaeon BRNA1]|nr:Coenzyme F420-reducing hydrogenase, gamma subunit [Thermoplasmatales archaeon BRNA1]
MGFFSNLFKKKEKKTEAKKEAAPKAAPAKAAPAAAPAKAAPAANGKTGFVEYKAADLPKGAAALIGAPPGGKIKVAIYWAAGCGGCDVSILDTNETVLSVADMADIVMWPIAVDGKEKDIEAMEDGEITVSIINGAIRNSENEHMVKLLRQKSKLVVAYGSCAVFGGTPSLANLVAGGAKEILEYVYTKTPTSAQYQKDYHADAPCVPQTSFEAPEGTLTLPVVYDTVHSLDQVIDVDYFIPGCPPIYESITHLVKALVDFVYSGVPLPPKGTEIGVTEKCMCDECPREKTYARITEIKEPYQVNIDPDKCLMDQGILCLGPATVGGCNARCTRVGQPCRGCYGPTHFVTEHGASALSAIASLFPVLDDDPIMDEERVISIMSSIKDPLGYFYAYTIGKSLINRAVKEETA